MFPKIQIWQWPNLLAIDAALIAVVWQITLARVLGYPLEPASSLVLALSVWLSYTADRLFDVARRPSETLLSSRHSFIKRHAQRLWFIWAAVLFLNLIAAFTGLSATNLQKGTLLLALCLIYTFLNQKLSRRFFPKEALVALIYTGGVIVFQQTLVPLRFAIILALLVFFNCLIIGAKERVVDAKLEVRSMVGWITDRWLGPIALCLHLLAFYLATPGSIALSMGFLFIGSLHLFRKRIPVEIFRVLADAALFFSALIWFAWWAVAV